MTTMRRIEVIYVIEYTEYDVLCLAQTTRTKPRLNDERKFYYVKTEQLPSRQKITKIQLEVYLHKYVPLS